MSYLVDLIANANEHLPSLNWGKSESGKRYFELSKRAQQITDRSERQALFRLLRDELEAEVPITPLVIPERIYAMRSNVAYHADEQFSFDLHPHSFFNR